MADLIIEAPGVYYTGFSTGQGGDPSTYKLYAEHLDVNFDTLLYAVNRIWTRLSAMTGFNAALISYVLELNDPGGPEGAAVDTGRVGAHSYECALKGGDATKIEVQPGSALRAAQLVTLTSMQEVDGTGVVASPPGWAYLSWDANGTVLIDDNTSAYDFARWYWSGGQFTGSVEYLTPTLFDGDAWREFQERPANLSFPSGTIELPHNRVLALERILSGYDTDGLGNAIGPLALPFGGVTDPQVCFGSAGSPDSAGFYRPATDEWAYTDGTSQVLRFADDGIHVAVGGSAGTTALSVGNEEDTGFYLDTPNYLACAGGGVRSCRFNNGQTLIEDGAVEAPGLAFGSDANTGIWTDTADMLKMSTGGGYCFGADPTGNLDFPLNSRCRTLANAQSISGSGTGTGTNINFNGTDVYDVGDWHDPATNPDRHTCPTGADGTYTIRATVRFLESTAGGGGTANTVDYRLVQVTVNGSAVDHAAQLVPPTGTTAALDTILTVEEELELSAADIVRIQCDHDNGGTMNVEAECTISKVA